MPDRDDRERTEALGDIGEVIRRYGPAASGSATSAETMAQEWIDAGFDDAEEIEDWLRAGCVSAAGAQMLERAGITPQQAAFRTKAGRTDREESIGSKIVNGELSIDEARRIITNEFWNS